MGYFDADPSGYFEADQRGRKLFLPWGLWGRVSVIPSEDDYQRLGRALKTYMVGCKFYGVLLAIQVGVISGVLGYFGLQRDFSVGIFLGVWLSFFALRFVHYMVLVRFSLLHGLQPLPPGVRVHPSASSLWLGEIVSIVFFAIGIAMVIIDVGNWLIAVGLIVVFGFGAVESACRLALRWRAVRPSSS